MLLWSETIIHTSISCCKNLLAIFHCLEVISFNVLIFPCFDSLLVDGLEKSSLANCDVVGSSQSSQLKGKGGKLSSLGKIFKPWKWRKKRTSDKFQDLSKGISLIAFCFYVYAWDSTSIYVQYIQNVVITFIPYWLFLMLAHNFMKVTSSSMIFKWWLSWMDTVDMPRIIKFIAHNILQLAAACTFTELCEP